jgi:tripartite-type tricarboxylate transporter receptor subunit TctC
MINRRHLLLAPGLLALPALAQAVFPNRPIRLVVAFPAGGPTDVLARVIGERMAVDLGQPVIIENRGGANGNIAAEAVSKMDADGYNLLYNTSSIATSRALYKRLAYDVLSDLTPVALTAAAPSLLVVNPALPVRNAAEFIAWARTNSGRISYSSGGVGNASHLQAFMVMKHIGAEAVHVPYRGTAAAMTDVAAGNVQFMSDALNTALPLARGGQVRAIAVTTGRRSAQLPDIPTMAESGLMPAESDSGIWQGIMAPARTPQELVARLNQAVNAALRDPGVAARVDQMGAWPTGGTPEAYKRYLDSEIALWARVVPETGASED